MSEMTKGAKVNSARRDFLKSAGLAGGVAAVALTTEAVAEAPVAEEPVKRSQGYRETEHVRAYYQIARI